MPDVKPILLVVGAKPGSLGKAVAEYAKEYGDYRLVETAGISMEEDHYVDITDTVRVGDMLKKVRPDHIVCTVGINMPAGIFEPFLGSMMQEAFRTNVVGPMQLLRQFSIQTDTVFTQPKFLVVSSNSARIARTKSIPYCASKAALSMAVRCAARELARENAGTLVWGYEPGLLNTSMTREMFPETPTPENGVGPFHRMEGVEIGGIWPELLAERIITDLSLKGKALNGCMIPFDAGEQ